MNFFGSEKYFANRTPESVNNLDSAIDNRTAAGWFLKQKNRNYLQNRIIREKINVDEISLIASMNIWAKKNKLHSKNLKCEVTGITDYLTATDQLNQQFLNHLRERFGSFTPLSNTHNIIQQNNTYTTDEDDLSNYNMINGKSVIMDGMLVRTDQDQEGQLMQKSATYMTAEDIRNIDVYDPTYDRDLYTQTLGMVNKRSRRNNMQKYMHRRHIDYDASDGFRAKEDDRASLDNLVRGFDMSEFRRYAVNSHRPISRYQFQ